MQILQQPSSHASHTPNIAYSYSPVDPHLLNILTSESGLPSSTHSRPPPQPRKKLPARRPNDDDPLLLAAASAVGPE